jgi:phosphatidylethanolamine-binding protein (PEBP) family uncharacterized protein
LIQANISFNLCVKKEKHKRKRQMKAKKNRSGTTIVLFIILIVWNCRKEYTSPQEIPGFILSSPEIGADSLLPVDYTCDGTDATLPLEWTGAPASTISYAIIMHHEASPTDIHWYWVVYDIPTGTKSLPRNMSGTGILGTNSVNDKTEYAPPCSQGPGIKAYTYTIYALSQNPVISVSSDMVTREVLLNAIEDITIASAKLTVYYSRNI